MANDDSSTQLPGDVASGIQNKKLLLIVALAGLFIALVAAMAVYVLTRPVDGSQVSGQVSVTADGFVPQTIQIKKGQSVTWTNTGEGLHYVLGDTSEEGAAGDIDSGSKLQPGDTFTYTFEDTGTFTYHDRDNPIASKGVVSVTE